MIKTNDSQTSLPLTLQTSAFTLAEVMIVLAIISVLVAILLPVARNATPNEDIMKFKKAHNTLYTAIRELVNSDKYYQDGDLGIRANGNLVDGTHDGDYTYLCTTLADVIDIKKVNCLDIKTSIDGDIAFGVKKEVWIMSEDEAALTLDLRCSTIQSEMQDEIITANDLSFFNVNPKVVFGFNVAQKQGIDIDVDCDEYLRTWCSLRWFGQEIAPTWNDDGLIIMYKTFCLDIDGINNGEAPFGYAIRVDGKIFAGAKAQEWLQKSIQKAD